MNFIHASNLCKMALEAAKLVYTSKTRDSITSQKLDSCDFLQTDNSFLNNGKSALQFNLYLQVLEFCHLHPIKQSYLLKSFCEFIIMMTQVSL